MGKWNVGNAVTSCFIKADYAIAWNFFFLRKISNYFLFGFDNVAGNRLIVFIIYCNIFTRVDKKTMEYFLKVLINRCLEIWKKNVYRRENKSLLWKELRLVLDQTF